MVAVEQRVMYNIALDENLLLDTLGYAGIRWDTLGYADQK